MASPLHEHISRPPNAFILYRSHTRKHLPPPAPGIKLQENEFSKQAAQLWKNENPEVKKDFQRQAVLAKIEHKALHPDYKFTWCKRKGQAKEEQKKGKKRKAAESAEPAPLHPYSFVMEDIASVTKALHPPTPSEPIEIKDDQLSESPQAFDDEWRATVIRILQGLTVEQLMQLDPSA
ncbi:hypothetical protein DXG01_002799 [Tephrocybe rancida]|nr:hypothetical protein DXG01_002799 [Tephrocybe rancida]